jgi:hypothetical protein
MACVPYLRVFRAATKPVNYSIGASSPLAAGDLTYCATLT